MLCIGVVHSNERRFRFCGFVSDHTVIEYVRTSLSMVGNTSLIAKYDGLVVGSAELSMVSSKCVELSFVTRHEYCRRVIGSLLVQTAIEEAKNLRLESIISSSLVGNDICKGIFRRFGFECLAREWVHSDYEWRLSLL